MGEVLLRAQIKNGGVKIGNEKSFVKGVVCPVKIKGEF